MESLRIYAAFRGHGARGPRYRVHMNTATGMVLVEGSTEPLLDAARILIAKGITGKLQLWDDTRPYWRIQGDIERLAGVTVTEGQHGIALRKYAERTASGDFEGGPVDGAQKGNDRPGSILQDIGANEHHDDADAQFSARSTSRSAVAA